jgi:CRISPR-associated protein (TIGR03984 family)
LRAGTLQQVRIFGPAGELYLWRGDGEWRGRYLAARAEDDTLTTHYLLWGDSVKGRMSGDFQLLSDGVEGLHHAPPLLPETSFDPKRQNLGVQVQHTVAYDEDGQAHIAASRLVALVVVDKKEEK